MKPTQEGRETRSRRAMNVYNAVSIKQVVLVIQYRLPVIIITIINITYK